MRPFSGLLLYSLTTSLASQHNPFARRFHATLGTTPSEALAPMRRLFDLCAKIVVIVGDRLETDIRMGIDAGMATGLVLTERSWWLRVSNQRCYSNGSMGFWNRWARKEGFHENR